MQRYYVDGAVTPEFAVAFERLASAWDAAPSQERVRAYAKALNDVPRERLLAAFAACMKEYRMFPSIADVLRHVTPGADDEALLAWTGLCRAVERAGAWASVVVEDGAAAQALLDVFGSWPSFCGIDDGPELALKRQQFLAAYRQARRAVGRAPRRLEGRCEAASGNAGELAPATCVWRVAGAGVGPARDRAQLPAGHERTALMEGADAQAAQGPPEAEGTGGRS
jgi:hypothetical protein